MKADPTPPIPRGNSSTQCRSRAEGRLPEPVPGKLVAGAKQNTEVRPCLDLRKPATPTAPLARRIAVEVRPNPFLLGTLVERRPSPRLELRFVALVVESYAAFAAGIDELVSATTSHDA